MTRTIADELFDYLAHGLDEVAREYADANNIPVNTPEELRKVKESFHGQEYIHEARREYENNDTAYDAPPYLFMWPQGIIKPGTWLVHLTKSKCFSGFDRGTRIKRLHLATWSKRKIKVTSRSVNLSPSLPFEKRVWGFAFFPGEADMVTTGEDPEKYGTNFVIFQCDLGVGVEHQTDEEEQIVFPIGADYNHVCGTTDFEKGCLYVDGLRFESFVDAVKHLREKGQS